MKQGQKKSAGGFLGFLFSMSLALLLAGCGGGGGSSSTTTTGGTTPTTTTVSGKVTLSSTVTGKPGMKKAAMMKAMQGAPKGKPGSKAYAASKQSSTALKSALLGPVLNASAFASGTVYLYNSDHPEWLSPVASSPTDSTGAYSMSKLENAASNGNAYTDGAGIPSGNYTLLAFKSGGFDPILGVTTTALVAVQTVVNKFEGTVTIPDLVAQESTALPTVSAMFGVKQNTDGTQTWGSSATNMPANAAIQVNFSAAMSRGTLTNGITISPAVSGKWSLSADWTTATFYPDTGVALAANTVYTIIVKGSDTWATAAVKNVYGNALAKTATGTFTATAADTVAPTAIFVSPTTAQLAAPVDVTVPIRIGSNRQLDVNGLTLVGNVAGVSSLGAKPGVLYVGKDATSSLYVYEFVLGAPLQLGTTYDLTVSGGKGLNGIAMNSLTGSLVTTSAAATTGVDTTATAATQNAQAAVKDVLGKWIRAFSDRNITQLKSLMSGDFYFEETKAGSSDDLNHDGRLSLSEFSDMISLHAFPQWEYCGTTITGDVVGTINVVGNNADFEFKMVATSTNTSQQCLDTMPTTPFYATLQNVNGAWTIVRASEGIDTRAKTISFPDLINTLKLTQDQAGVATDIADGGQIQLNYDPLTQTEVKPLTYSWGAATGVSSYVLIRMDARDPENGRACALPTSKLVFTTVASGGCVTNGGVNVDGKFGFNTDPNRPVLHVDGGQYYWEVIGLATTTVSTIANKTPLDILKDISAVSALHSYTIAGVYKEITVQVYGGATATGTPATYSVNYDGYDVGTASQATITVTTANTLATNGDLHVDGNFSKNYPLTFVSGVATVTVDLSKGQNWIWVNDCVGVSCGTGLGLNKGFSISTTGGIAPVVDIATVTDDKGNLLAPDQWGYVKATTGATKVTITGTVATTSGITAVDVNVWNDAFSAYNYVSAPVTAGTFSATLDIYKGDNWINAGSGTPDPTVTGSWIWYGDHVGVYTDTGTVWVPNISVTSVTTATSTGNFGSSSDWDASLDLDGVVTIVGKLKNPLGGTYNISSDGGWSNGTLIALADGSFTLDVTLYKGWNYVSLSDSNYNWYGVNIYTTGGKTVVKPTITLVNGTAPVVTVAGGASVATTGCTATVTGTAKAGNLNVNWNGFDGLNYNYESQTLVLTGAADTPIAFSFNVPLVGGAGSYNNIDVYDLNWIWTGVKVTTSGTCSYVAPTMTVASVLNSAGAAITYDTVSMSYPAGASQTVTVSGTSSRAGRAITASSWACSSQNYSATAVSVADGTDPVTGTPTYSWSIPGIKVYDGWNSVGISDGPNWSNVSVSTTNLTFAQPALTATVVGLTATYTGTCGYNQWDAGALTAVDITGTTTAPDGTGTYTDATGSNLSFTIAGGNYSILNVALYDGYNSIYINDTAWNSQSVNINTTNGNPKPKFVAITAPANMVAGVAVAVTGAQTVTGTVTDNLLAPTGYKPKIVQASVGVYDSATFMWTYTYYSSDANQQAMYGNSPITYNATAGTFSFSVDFGAAPNGKNTYVDVYAYDDVIYKSHGMTMYYNDPYGYNSTYYYKPGAKAKAASGNQAVTSELMKQRLKSINKNR